MVGYLDIWILEYLVLILIMMVIIVMMMQWFDLIRKRKRRKVWSIKLQQSSTVHRPCFDKIICSISFQHLFSIYSSTFILVLKCPLSRLLQTKFVNSKLLDIYSEMLDRPPAWLGKKFFLQLYLFFII